MNDELTPSEKEALAGLPRERMPSAGLEDRVAGALRARGVLKKPPRRAFGWTTGRAISAIAASIALVIGGYSIGMWRGEGPPAAVETQSTITEETPLRTETVVQQDEDDEKIASAEKPAATPVLEEEQPATEADKLEATNEPVRTNVLEQKAVKTDELTAGSGGRVEVAPREKVPAAKEPAPQKKSDSDASATKPQPKLQLSDAPARERQDGDVPGAKDEVAEVGKASDLEGGSSTSPPPEMSSRGSLSKIKSAWSTVYVLDGKKISVESESQVAGSVDEQTDQLVITTGDGPILVRLAASIKPESGKLVGKSSSAAPAMRDDRERRFTVGAISFLLTIPGDWRTELDEDNGVITIVTPTGKVYLRPVATD